MIGLILGFKYPKTCENCKLFIDGIVGLSAFCAAGGEYSDDEIEKAEDGNLQIYYHGCLTTRPKNCPLTDVFLDDDEEADNDRETDLRQIDRVCEE